MIPIPGGELDCIGRFGSDLDIVNAAKVSFARSSLNYGESEDGILRFLLQNRHGSPVEHGYLRFFVKAPIFVFREWHRHRVGWSYNEMSGRYTKLEPEFYLPDTLRKQVGRAGQYTYVALADEHEETAKDTINFNYGMNWAAYERLLDQGVAKEQARLVLPVGIMSQMWASCNPRSLIHFLSLRTHETAQFEIRQYAHAMEETLKEHWPRTWHWWNESGRQAI